MEDPDLDAAELPRGAYLDGRPADIPLHPLQRGNKDIPVKPSQGFTPLQSPSKGE